MNPPLAACIWQLAAEPTVSARIPFAKEGLAAQHHGVLGASQDRLGVNIPTPSYTSRFGLRVEPHLCRGTDRRSFADVFSARAMSALKRAFSCKGDWLESRQINISAGGSFSCARSRSFSPSCRRPSLRAACRPMVSAPSPVLLLAPSRLTRSTPTSSLALLLARSRAPIATTPASAADRTTDIRLMRAADRGQSAVSIDAVGVSDSGGILFSVITANRRAGQAHRLHPEGRD